MMKRDQRNATGSLRAMIKTRPRVIKDVSRRNVTLTLRN